MTLGDLSGDDSGTDSDNDDASVSYIYLYEEGRSEIDNWDDEAQELAAKAYEAASNGGIVRRTFNNTSAYENIHHAYSELTWAMGEVFENGDFQPMLNFIGPDAEALAQHLDDNPELLSDLNERMQTTEATADD